MNNMLKSCNTASLFALLNVTIQTQFNRQLNDAVRKAAENFVISQVERSTKEAENKAIDDVLGGQRLLSQ